MIYSKNCPSCGNIQIYSNKYTLKYAIQLEIKCTCCSHIGNTHNTQTKLKISNTSRGRIVTEETKQKISTTLNGRIVTKETRQKMSISAKNKPPISDETRQKNSKSNKKYYETHKHHQTGKPRTPVTKQKISTTQTGRVHSIETKRKIRISSISYIEKCKLNGGQLSPSYNSSSIPILEQKAKELNIVDLQHAENGGEYFINELGYWVDGYSKDKNIVIEYYEKFHNKKIKRDLRRQKEIIKFLNCEFIIIKE